MSLIRTVLGGLLFLAVAALVVWLVYSNDQPATLRLAGLWGGQGMPQPFNWSFEPQPLVLPIGLWYFAFTIFGIFVGLLLGWFIAGQTRVLARKQGNRAKQAERALEKLRQEADLAQTQADVLRIEKKELEAQAKNSKFAKDSKQQSLGPDPKD